MSIAADTTFMPGSTSTPATHIGEFMLYDDESLLEGEQIQSDYFCSSQLIKTFIVKTKNVFRRLSQGSHPTDCTTQNLGSRFFF